MSYILDALKKAEREREIARIPTLMTVHDARDEVSHGRKWAMIGSALTVIALLVLSISLLLKPKAGHAPSPVAGAGSGKPEQPAFSPVLEAPAGLPAPMAVPANAVAARHQADLSDARSPAVRGLPVNQAAADTAGTSAPKPLPQSESSPGIAKASTQPSPVAQSAVPKSTLETPSSAGTQPAPTSLREAMAKMTMTILLYSEIKSERMAFINDRKYVEGEYIDGRYFLESITPEGAVLSFQDERALLRSRAK